MSARSVRGDDSRPSVASGTRCADCGARYYTGVEAWYRACQPRLVRLIRQRYGTSVDAEDAVQNAFERLAGYIDVVNDPGGWLYVVAWRSAERSREDQARSAPCDVDGRLATDGARLRWTSLSPTVPDVETLVAARARLRTALRAITLLPERQRAAFYLHRVEGWTQREIADHFGCSAAAVAVHVYRATSTVRRTVKIIENQPVMIGDGNNINVFLRPVLGGAEDALPLLRSWVWCRCWSGNPLRATGEIS